MTPNQPEVGAGKKKPQAMAVKRPAPPQSQMVEKVTTAAIKALYSKRETVQGVLQMIRGAKRPESGIARAAFAIIEQIKEKMTGVDPRIANAAIPDIITEIVRIAIKAGVMKPDKGIVERATKILLQELQRPQQRQQQQAPAAPAQPQAQAGAMPPEQGMAPGGGMISQMMGG